MKKCSFLVYYKELDEFLEQIRNLGLVHIETEKNIIYEDADLADKLKFITEIGNWIKYTEKLGIANTEENPSIEKGKEAILALENIKEDKSKIQTEIQNIEKDINVMNVWNDFDLKTIENLKQAGWKTSFFSCTTKKYNPKWETQFNAFLINKLGQNNYFVTFTKENETIEIDADSIKICDKSLSSLIKAKEECTKKLEELDDSEKNIAKNHLTSIYFLLNDSKNDFQFAHVNKSTSKEVDDKVILVKGYIPSKNEKDIVEAIKEKPIYYEIKDPEKDDKVPIQLTNNKFARLFEPIGMLYELPKHNELDLTPYFAPFYMMFFGFCLGDAGYGLILLLAGTFLKKKLPSIKGYLTLAQIFGVSTIIFGIITGTFFGISLVKANIPFLKDVTKYMLTTDNLFTLAIGFGVLQILFGMFVKILNSIKRYGFGGALAPLGWFILAFGLIVIKAAAYKNLLTPHVASISTYIVMGITGILILLLNDLKRNPLINIGAGLWDVYQMVTGFLGDLLSYIRLFALNISGAILGFVFNELALNLKPDIPVVGAIVMIVILLIGHGITMFMSVLGSFVHPIRLTFVEFYKNSGFEGGGKQYSPFAENKIINNK